MRPAVLNLLLLAAVLALAAAGLGLGEVGLSGEIRGIPQSALRVREAVQMGFTRILLPVANLDPAEAAIAGIELVGVKTVNEALDQLIA